jgi:hypothetical protein
MGSQRNRLFYLAVLATASAVPGPMATSLGQMRNETSAIPFAGHASGGALVISETLNRNCGFITLLTTPDESADSVAHRLAEAIRAQNPFGWLGSGGATASASAGTVTGMAGSSANYMTGGTETGLGIPAPPTSLTCNYDAASKSLRLRWTNPTLSSYDSIRVVYNYHNYDHRGERTLAGEQETTVIDFSTTTKVGAIEDFDVWIIGVSHEIPSDAAAMHVRGQVQEELFGIPFARGVAPNWAAWSADKDGAASCDMGQREDLVFKASVRRRYNGVETPETKPFYQTLTLSGPAGNPGGIRRDFLGLTPGHAYRLSVRLSTLELGPDSGTWSYSLHATPFRSAGPALTPDQMAGLAPLPDGTKGECAGLVTKYDARRTTAGRYDEAAQEIVLPEGMDSIAVWLKFMGDKPGNKVAMDYAKLEDLGAR